MISLAESILSSTGSGKKTAIYKSLAKLLKEYKDEGNFISSSSKQLVCIPKEDISYLNNIIRFHFYKYNDKALKKWLKSNGYKSAIKTDLNYGVDLFELEDNKYYQPTEEHLNDWYFMYIFKVDNTAVFIENVKGKGGFSEVYVFAKEINPNSTYAGDWKTDQTFVNIVKNELE